jgi:hypothetical protein
METPPFLEHLGLTEAVSDEREIKRAYARLLKQVDQEADPAGFQKLREAYETSLGWFGWRQRQQAMLAEEEAEEAVVTTQSPESATLAESSTTQSQAAASDVAIEVQHDHRVDDNSPPASAAEPVPAPEPERPLPQDHAAALFDQYFSHACSNEQDAAARLNMCLDDDRLIDLETRAIFEYRVAHALAEGYTDGKHFLWKAAQAAFGWDDDHTRLRHFHQAGHVLENALGEQDVFEHQDESRRQEQARLMDRLRDARRPHDSEFSRLMPVLEWMLGSFPNLMWVTTKAENVQAWREHHETLPQSLRAMREPTPTSDPAMLQPSKNEESGSSGKAWMFFVLCIIGLTNFFKLIGNDHPAPSSHAADPAYQAQVTAHLREHTERVTRELQEAMASAPSSPASGNQSAKIINPGELAQLLYGAPTAERCERASALANELVTDQSAPDPRLGPTFDSFVTECVYKNLWPNRGDPVSKAAMRRDVAHSRHDRAAAIPRPRAETAGYRAFPQALARMTEPPVSAAKCSEAEQFAQDYSLGSARTNLDFGLAFNALIIDCADAGLWRDSGALDWARLHVPRNLLPSARNQREELLRLAGSPAPPGPTAQVATVRDSSRTQKSP